MRHDTGACGTIVGQLYECKVLTAEHAGIKGQFADGTCYAGKGKGHVAFCLAASHLCINHIVVHRVEPKQFCRHGAVQGKTATVSCSRTQWVAVGHTEGGLQEHHIIHQTFGICTEPQTEAAGHSHLKMCVARHQYILVTLTLRLQLLEEFHHI